MNLGEPQETRFLKLIEENRPKILKICRVYAWNPSDRDDLYQEILFQIWRALPGLKEEGYAGTWVYRVALNTSISFIRKQSGRKGSATPSSPEDLAWRIESAQETVQTDDAQVSRLYEAIAQLNASEKAVITLFLEELSYEQMASVLGVTESNVGVMLHRAKKKLSTLMKEGACTTTP